MRCRRDYRAALDGAFSQRAMYTGANKEAKFGITMSLLNFRLRPSIKNHLRQHWIDRCSPWHLCDITVHQQIDDTDS